MSQTWDEEIKAIQLDVEALSAYYLKPGNRERNRLRTLKSKIIAQETQLRSLINQIMRADARKMVLGENSHSLLHWSSILAQKAAKFQQDFVRQHGKYMWLNLLRTRLPGGDVRTSNAISDEQILEVALRKKHLDKTEKKLRERLGEAALQKTRLTQRYQDLLASRANREAASTMQARYGHDLSESDKNPYLTGLGSLFRGMRRRFGINQKQREANQMERDLARKADQIVTDCRSLALNNTQPSGEREFQLSEIEDLEQRLNETAMTLADPNLSQAPIRVRKDKFHSTDL